MACSSSPISPSFASSSRSAAIRAIRSARAEWSAVTPGESAVRSARAVVGGAFARRGAPLGDVGPGHTATPFKRNQCNQGN